MEYSDEVKTGLMVHVCVLHRSKKNWESFWPLFLLYHRYIEREKNTRYYIDMCPKHFSERETTRFSLFCNSNVDRKFFFKKRPFYKEVNIEYTPKSGKKIKVFLYLTCLLLYIDNVCITKIQRWKGVRFEVHLLHSSRCREKGEAIWPFPPRWLKRPNRVERHKSM